MTDLCTYPSAPGWKRTETSRDAAKSMRGRADTLRDACLDALRTNGPMTADEIAEHLNESVLSIRPRITELKELHAVSPTGERRRNKSGRGADVMEAI